MKKPDFLVQFAPQVQESKVAITTSMLILSSCFQVFRGRKERGNI